MNADFISPGAFKPEHDLRRELCLAGRWLYERGFAVSTEGNLSVRLAEGRLLTTPAGICKGRMQPDDLVITDNVGRQLAGEGRPSSELAMHLLIYRLRPDVGAICHAHPPIATGFAAAGRALDKAMLPEIIVTLGQVPLARYATPGTPDLCDSLAPLVPHHDAILMANHGAVTCGPDLLTAFQRMEAVEQFAKVTLVTELLGRQNLLSEQDVATLLEARSRYGVAPPPGARPAPPVTREAAEAQATDRITLSRAELDALIEDALRRSRSQR
jgi:L-fuculose-phosphate aldolase